MTKPRKGARSLEDTASMKALGLAGIARAKPAEGTDLRELSAWMRLQRDVAALKKQGTGMDATAARPLDRTFAKRLIDALQRPMRRYT
jgi:hypothetical protein